MTPSAISSDVHSAINRFETINSEPYPYITPQLTGNTHFSQARMNYLHAPKFSSQNISSPDELNHILRISPQQKSDTMERKRNNMKAQHEIQEEDELQTIGLLNVLDPGTLSALHHISKEELQRVSMSPAPNSSRASSLELNSTGGGLGQDEYLLHRTHSIMDRIGGTKGGLSIGTEARVGTGLEFGSSGNYEYAVTSADRFGGDNAGSSRRNNSDNQGADTLDEGLSWATNRQENITSSEIACQLFSGLDVFRRREEEGRMITNKIGVGIGTTIGSRTYCENDSSGRHQISEDFSRSESPNERWQRILDEYNHN
ncbi:hypothetical protein FBU30_008280 [Linnemannia zychae]|nr:hypothetical protein FBU30_008280 [Linnemannia zychae]